MHLGHGSDPLASIHTYTHNPSLMQLHDPRPRTTSVSYGYAQFHPRQLLLSKMTEQPGSGRPPTPSRPQTPRTQIYDHVGSGEGPWKQMAHTYAWVVEQELVRQQKSDRHGEHWVLKQPLSPFVADHFLPRRERKGSITESVRGRERERSAYEFWEAGTRWMKHEEESRRLAVDREREREREKTRVVQDELRRIEARVRQRRNQERERLAEERVKANAERERVKAERVVVDAWRDYETRWAALMRSTDGITFGTIPWPTMTAPAGPAGIRPADIVLFLFSPVHSQNQSRKERLKTALLRWHPDRFRRLLSRVSTDDRGRVEEGVGIVARCLNDLMARESKIA